MTHDELASFCLRARIELSPEETADILRSANMDPHEGASWLPYYKAALGLLALMVGMMEGGKRTSDPTVSRLWHLHMLLCGIGPDEDTERAATIRRIADAAMPAFRSPGKKSS